MSHLTVERGSQFTNAGRIDQHFVVRAYKRSGFFKGIWDCTPNKYRLVEWLNKSIVHLKSVARLTPKCHADHLARCVTTCARFRLNTKGDSATIKLAQ